METFISNDQTVTAHKSPLRSGAVTSALWCLCASAALNAGETRATLNVAVTVPPIARMDILSPLPTVQITPQDLQRGYLELSEPTLVSIYSNAPEGFALEVLPMSPVIQAIAVRGLGAQADLGAQGGRIVERWAHPQTTTLSLTFRLALAPNTQPGIYPWPLHLAIGPVSDTP
jgi:hypothetical protein